MAKKKKGKSGKSKSKKMGFNTSKMIGMAGGIFARKKFLDTMISKYITDPKMKAVAYIALGELAPKQDFVKNFMKDEDITRGAGDSMINYGIESLMAEMGISGMGGPSDSDELAVVIEGVDDMDADVLGDDDLGVVNADVLGDDDLGVVNEDMGEDMGY